MPRFPRNADPVIRRMANLRLLMVRHPNKPQTELWRAEDAIPQLRQRLMAGHGLAEHEIEARLETAEREMLEGLARDERRRRNAIVRLEAELKGLREKGSATPAMMARAVTLARWLTVLLGKP